MCCTWCFQHHSKVLSSAKVIWTAEMSSRLIPGTPSFATQSAAHYKSRRQHELHPAPLRLTIFPCFPVNLLICMLYLLLYTSLYIPSFTSCKREPTASHGRNYYLQKNHEAHIERALARAVHMSANHHCESNVGNSNPACEYSGGASYSPG